MCHVVICLQSGAPHGRACPAKAGRVGRPPPGAGRGIPPNAMLVLLTMAEQAPGNAVEASLSRCCKLGRNRSKDACRIICWTPSACARSSRSKTVFMQHGLGCQRLSPPPPPNRMSVMLSRLKTLLLRLVFRPLKRSLNAENEKLCDSVKKPLGCAKPHVLKVPRRHSLF